MKKKYEKCDLCGKKYKLGFNDQYLCPECQKSVRYNTIVPNESVTHAELRIRSTAEERAKKNDRIVGEGYAERQIADTLRRIPKIKTEL